MHPTPRYLPGEILGALYRRKGPVITATAGTARYAYLLGPETNRFAPP